MKSKKSLARKSGEKEYQLKLFITGNSPNSARAINNLKTICEKYLADMYTLEVIDIYQQPGIVRDLQIIALPLLVKQAPLPERKLIGDMSQTSKVLNGLGITPDE